MGMSYPPPTAFTRTPAQKKDMFLSWARDDRAFFGGGACHILAYLFYDLHKDEGYDIIFTRPRNKQQPGNHVYIYKNGWAFDAVGWTQEDEVLHVMREHHAKQFPDWDAERVVITGMDLETFCKEYDHRPPAYFPYLPWERAYKYIQEFASEPPKARP
jgi:hypothetical protein